MLLLGESNVKIPSTYLLSIYGTFSAFVFYLFFKFVACFETVAVEFVFERDLDKSLLNYTEVPFNEFFVVFRAWFLLLIKAPCPVLAWPASLGMAEFSPTIMKSP